MEFETHVTSLSFVHLRDLDNTAHQFVLEEYYSSRLLRSCRIAFVPSVDTQSVMGISPDGVTGSISEFVCWAYRLLAHLDSGALDQSSDWLQARFAAQALGAYLEGPIRTRQDTPALTTLPDSFQGLIAVVSLQCAFSGHCLTAPDAPPAITDAPPFQLTRLLPSAFRPTLS